MQCHLKMFKPTVSERGNGHGDGTLKAPGYIHFVFGGFFACHVKSCNNNNRKSIAIVYYMRVNQNSDRELFHPSTTTTIAQLFPRLSFPFTIKHIQNRKMELFIFQLWHWVSTFCVYLFKCYFALLVLGAWCAKIEL